MPRRYEDRRKIIEASRAKIGEEQAIKGRVVSSRLFTARTGTRILDVTLKSGGRTIHAVWYNMPYLKSKFPAGMILVVYGKVELQRALQITHPVYEVIGEDNEGDNIEIGRIVPVYPLTENITQKYLRRVIYSALTEHAGELKEWLPSDIMARRSLVDERFAIENIHFPFSFDNVKRAYKRLVFEEFFLLQLIMALRRSKIMKRGKKHDRAELSLEEFEGLFSFDLTLSQKRCVKDIEKDMKSGSPMYRLVQGDVGSGKTVTAMYAALLAVRNGSQAAIMAPTEILARQHFREISKVFMPLGVNVQLLVSGMDPGVSRRVRKDAAEGTIDVLVGTHALIQEGIDYDDLGLAVIDEQHKFGVEQRGALKEKGKTPDVLVMTATPIPRSLVLTLFGDMDVSVIREKPPGRKEIYTYWVKEQQRKYIYSFIREEISKGRQAYVVYPVIKRTAGTDLRSAEEMYDNFRSGVFSDLSVALVHGKMKASEKKTVMERFKAGEHDILITTTLIEVGVDVPNASVMLIEHAERYGLAQLHQLRGRIGRSNFDSYCILMGDPATEDAALRLSAVADISDGFEIAEKDLDIRGPGEFLGTKQSGLPDIKIGDIGKDHLIMEYARTEARELIEKDPGLKSLHNRGIRRRLIEKFGKKRENPENGGT
jgi:ATP-dependent DNA helicase RecG